MHRERDRGVAGDRDRAADHADAERVEDAANDVRVVGEFAIVIEREHIEQFHAFAPGHDERAQRDAEQRHHHGDDKARTTIAAKANQRQPCSRSGCVFRPLPRTET